jgi:hypothetical protein
VHNSSSYFWIVTTMNSLTVNSELNASQSHSFPSEDSSSSSGDDDSESRSKSTQPNSSSHNDNGNSDMDRGLSKAFIDREERHVRRVRYALAGAILIFAFVVSGSVYMFAHRSEHHSFEHEVAFLLLLFYS